MKKIKVFIDGQYGTTGLQIVQKLKNHEFVDIIEISDEDKKNLQSKKSIIKESDVVFLCLPDSQSVEAFNLIKKHNINAKVIDASTTHRCYENWVYGLPELGFDYREKIKNAKLVANPGCYATGAILLLFPLVKYNQIFKKINYIINGISGYSGGGKSLIKLYENNPNSSRFSLYSLDLNHKHIPEIVKVCSLDYSPIFIPSVVNLKQGMIIQISLDLKDLNIKSNDIKNLYKNFYKNEEFVNYYEFNDDFFDIEGLVDTNFVNLYVFNNFEKDKVLLIAKLDNLGKGASSAAIQNMNIMFNLPQNISLK